MITLHVEYGKKRYKSDLVREGQRMRDTLEMIHNQDKSMESIDGLALAAIEEAKELVDKSVEAFKNGSSKRENVKTVAYAFYSLPHKMKEEDQKLFAEFNDRDRDRRQRERQHNHDVSELNEGNQRTSAACQTVKEKLGTLQGLLSSSRKI